MDIRRYDIVQADLGKSVGSEQAGIRPVLIVQNDQGNTVECYALLLLHILIKIVK